MGAAATESPTAAAAVGAAAAANGRASTRTQAFDVVVATLTLQQHPPQLLLPGPAAGPAAGSAAGPATAVPFPVAALFVPCLGSLDLSRSGASPLLGSIPGVVGSARLGPAATLTVGGKLQKQ